MSTFTVLTRYTNKEDGLEAYVTTVNHIDFCVSLKDTDANEFVGMALVFPNQEDAEAKALEIVDYDGPVTAAILV